MNTKIFPLLAPFLACLACCGPVTATTPTSENRLVFNQLEIPDVDLNGDGQIDILDVMQGLPAATDAIVYIGADSPSDLFVVNENGDAIIQDSEAAFGRIEEAAKLASELNVPLFLRGNFSARSSIRLHSNTYIEGYSSTPPVIHALFGGGTSLFSVLENSANVFLGNMKLVEIRQLQRSLVLLYGKNVNVTISEVEFEGSEVGMTELQTAGVFMFRDWVDDVQIRDCKFTDLQYGIHCVCGVQGLKILRNEFRRWNYYAVRVARLTLNPGVRTEDIEISHNDFRHAVAGPFRSVILVTRTDSLVYVKDVQINNNRVIGNGGAYNRGETDSNATGDQIVLHGVNGFQVSDNHVFYGGENGITTSRLSRNGVISRNIVFGNDTHGINIGSGYYELSVDNVAGIEEGDTIRGQLSEATGTVNSIRVHPSSGRYVLGLTRILGGRIFRNEWLDNTTTGVQQVVQCDTIDRTKGIRIVDNHISGNGRDSSGNTPWTHGLYVLNSDSLQIRRNRIFNPNYDENLNAGNLQDQRLSIYLGNSRDILISDDNQFELGRQELDEALGMNQSSWLSR